MTVNLQFDFYFEYSILNSVLSHPHWMKPVARESFAGFFYTNCAIRLHKRPARLGT